MEMTGTRSVPAPVNDVWQALNDPEILKLCIVGCESIEPDGPDAYRMVMAAKVGPVSAKFTGKMRLSDIDAPNAYTLRFDGSGGAAGFVNGEARVSLAPADIGTTLTYVAKAQVGGKLAQVGSRLIDGVAQKLTDDFFTRFVAALTPPVVEAPQDLTPAIEPAAVPASSGQRRVMYWVIAVVIVAVLALLSYVRS